MPADPPEPDNAPHHGDSDHGAPGWIGPPGPSGSPGNDRAPGTGAPQEWAAPPPQEDTPASPHTPTTPPTFTRTTGAILCVGGTLYTLLLAGLLTIAHVLIMFGAAVGASALVITTPVATLVLGALGFWSFRKVFDHAAVPSVTGATVLFTLTAVTSVVQAATLFHLTPVAYGYHPIAPAGVIGFAVAIALLLTRGRTLWWAILVLVLATLVRGLVEWQLSEAEHDRAFTETEDVFAAHPHDIAILDSPEWRSYRAETTQAQHPEREHVDDVFTVYHHNDSGTLLRITTWADDHTRHDPDQVLWGWCHDTDVVCQEHRTTDGRPVVLQYEPDNEPTPRSARIEYAPGAIAFLGPWDEPLPDPPADHVDPTDIDKDHLLELAQQVRTIDDKELAVLSRRTTEFTLEMRRIRR